MRKEVEANAVLESLWPYLQKQINRVARVNHVLAVVDVGDAVVGHLDLSETPHLLGQKSASASVREPLLYAIDELLSCLQAEEKHLNQDYRTV